MRNFAELIHNTIKDISGTTILLEKLFQYALMLEATRGVSKAREIRGWRMKRGVNHGRTTD